MNKIYSGALLICSVLGVSAQEVIWQKDIKSSTQDFLSQVTTTIDQQYLITGSSIRAGSGMMEAGSKSQMPNSSSKQQNNGYDFHLVKLNQQGEEVWEKYFSGQNHDFLSATVNTQDGGFVLAGTSFMILRIRVQHPESIINYQPSLMLKPAAISGRVITGSSSLIKKAK